MKDKDFCELFPDIAIEIKNKKKQRKLDLVNPTNGGKASTNHSTDSGENTAVYKLLTNLVFLAGLGLFAYAVKWVVGCVSEEV